MKKYIVFLLIIIYILTNLINTIVYSDSSNDIDRTPSQMQVSRCDCVCFIMLAIGAQSSSYPSNEPCIICEYDSKLLGEESVRAAEKYYVRCMFQMKRDLVHLAARDTGIINGEYRVGENNEYIFLNTYRTVRLDECLAFMVRCLEKDKSSHKTLEETFEIAKNYGLIIETDLFYNSPKKELVLADLRILLNRFLDKPLGLRRLSTESNFSDQWFEYDGISGKTYREYLTELFTEKFVDKLLSYDGSSQWEPGEFRREWRMSTL